MQHFFQGPELVVKIALWDLLSRVTVGMHAPVDDPLDRYLVPSRFREHAVSLVYVCISDTHRSCTPKSSRLSTAPCPTTCTVNINLLFLEWMLVCCIYLFIQTRNLLRQTTLTTSRTCWSATAQSINLTPPSRSDSTTSKMCLERITSLGPTRWTKWRPS